MRFICLEIDREAKIEDLLFGKNTSEDTVSDNQGNLLVKFFNSEIIGQGKVNKYGKEFTKKYFEILNESPPSEVISTFASTHDITLLDNLSSGLTTNQYQFTISALKDLQCSCWFTVLTEDGICFYLPKRVGKRITSYKKLATSYQSFEFNYQGETGINDYYVDVDARNSVLPITVDSSTKNALVNKKDALSNIIIIQSSTVADPGDYVLESGNTYIVLSCKEDVINKSFKYICVREADKPYTFTTNDISNPNIKGTSNLVYSETLAADADPWTISGLDLNAHGGVYDIWLDIKAVTADDLQMFVNGNFTAANYRQHHTLRDNATIWNGRANDAYIGYLDSSSYFPYRIILMTSAGCATGGVNAIIDDIDRNLYATTTWWSVTTNVTNVTSLTFDLINAKAIAAGSRIKIWKR